MIPKLSYACVFTRNIDRLSAFYREVLGLEPGGRPGYVEFQTPPAVFSLWAVDDIEQTTGTTVAANTAGSSIMLEFEVDDVDAEYARLRSLAHLAVQFVMPPRDLPWGNRSIYFRDPDGNLIDFFSHIR